VNDGRVGGDFLIGTATGAVMAVCLTLLHRLLAWAGQPALRPSSFGLDGLLGTREVAAAMILGEVNAAALGMVLLLMLLLLRLVMPEWLAVVLVLIVASIPDSLASDLSLAVAMPISAAGLAVPTLVLLRFGLLAAIANIFVVNQLISLPLTPNLGSWMGGPTVIVALVLGALLAFAFQAATTSRRRG